MRTARLYPNKVWMCVHVCGNVWRNHASKNTIFFFIDQVSRFCVILLRFLCLQLQLLFELLLPNKGKLTWLLTTVASIQWHFINFGLFQDPTVLLSITNFPLAYQTYSFKFVWQTWKLVSQYKPSLSLCGPVDWILEGPSSDFSQLPFRLIIQFRGPLYYCIS